MKNFFRRGRSSMIKQEKHFEGSEKIPEKSCKNNTKFELFSLMESLTSGSDVFLNFLMSNVYVLDIL